MNSSYFSACPVLVNLHLCKLSPDLGGEKRQGGMERPEGFDVLFAPASMWITPPERCGKPE